MTYSARNAALFGTTPSKAFRPHNLIDDCQYFDDPIVLLLPCCGQRRNGLPQRRDQFLPRELLLGPSRKTQKWLPAQFGYSAVQIQYLDPEGRQTDGLRFLGQSRIRQNPIKRRQQVFTGTPQITQLILRIPARGLPTFLVAIPPGLV